MQNSNNCVNCNFLPPFDKTSLAEVRLAFRQSSVIELGQSWLSKHEGWFRPATVRIGWQNEDLLVLAEMDGNDVFSLATALNQKTWELGDAFEIFLRPVQQSAYLEFHVTPNNQRLQLRFPDAEAVRGAKLSGDFQPFFLDGNVIESSSWVRPEEHRWIAFARIPATAVCDSPQPLAGQKWFFSFCRYNYRRDSEAPILSSSSPHQEADFHCQSAWRMMNFAGSPESLTDRESRSTGSYCSASS